MSPATDSRNPGLPRALVLASAGTGKTYTLSGTIIALLAAGIRPDSILASTFTRKAAGEILSRVLSRLAEAALSEDQARTLAEETRIPGLAPIPLPEPGFFLRLLETLVRDLHRLNIGTLDSFFMRVARGFSPDLGLPPGWFITDEPGAQGLEAEALHTILDGSSRKETVELVRMAMRGDWGRGIHGRLLGQLRGLRALIHQGGYGAEGSVWGPSLDHASPSDEEERARAAEALGAAQVPLTKAGKPDARFLKVVLQAQDALHEADWEAYCSSGIPAKLLKRETTFFGVEIPPDLARAAQAGLDLATRDLTAQLTKQAEALKTLAGAFDEAVNRLQRSRGRYRFHDVTYLLGGPDPVGSRPDLWFRLDQQSRHILLDEFQDTSLEQWEALEPLASEILSGHLEDRSATIVADPKQSIYGWRGADPLLVRRVGAAYSLRGRTLERSYRSSKWVLDLVNRIFGDLPSNPVWRDAEEDRLHVGIWARDFPSHRPAKDLPGFVRILAGPREDRMGSGERPRMMAWAADRIAELAREAPETSIGVLVRQNTAVARLIMELRNRGVGVSEEGATALEDSPAVSTVLALLRLSDHPGDTLAAYQVRLSPLGSLLPSTKAEMASWATAVGAQVRRALLDQGYGSTLTSWVREMGSAGALSHRDLQRLLQLTELAFRWDTRATLRPGDFVRFAQAERMEAPSGARVRVMTVHQAKGLEFDQVILPELDGIFTRGQGRYRGVFPLRDLETGRVVRIIPRLPRVLHPLIPELDEAAKQDRGAEIRDALGVLYVALTRARHALHLFVAENPDPGRLSRTYAGLIRGSLELDGRPSRSGDTLLSLGDPAWMRDPRMKTAEPEPSAPLPAPERPEPLIPRPRFAAAPIRRRNLHHRAPSALAGTGEVDLSTLLSLERENVRLRGTVVHCWLQTLQWMEEWAPTEEQLVALAHAEVPGISPPALQESLAAFRRWMEIPEVRTCLSRSSYPEGSRVATEYSFAIPLGPEFFRGRIDRVVFMPRAGVPEGAHVLDYKTDWIPEGNEEALQQKVREYSPQVRLYRKAISRTLGLEETGIRASLVFLTVGRVIEL